jgi:hypothetical protein
MKTRVPMWASASGGIALVLAGVVVASILLGASGVGGTIASASGILAVSSG